MNCTFVTWYLFHSFILFLNSNYFEFFGKLLNISSAYVFFTGIATLTKNLMIPLDRADLLFVVDIPLFLYLWYRHEEIALPPRALEIALRTSEAVAIPALLLLVFLPVKFDPNLTRQIDDSAIVSRYGILGHSIYDLTTLSKARPLDSITYGGTVVGQGAARPKPNIIMIQVESLGASTIDYKYHGTYIAPYLHGLAAKSIYFPYTLCCRSLGGTSDCEMAVNNSIEPLTSYPLIMDKNYTFPNSLVKILKKNGYSANAFHGNTGKSDRRLAA